MALRNAFGDLGLDSTLQAIRDRLPVALGGTGGVKVDVESSALPTGAATSAKQDTGNTSLSSIDGKITAVNTGAVTVSSSVLPASAATSTKQSDGTQKSQVVDGSGNVIGSTGNALDINIKSGNATTVTANAGTNLNTSALALDATLTGGTQQSKITDGTNVASTLKSDGTAAGQNAVMTSGTGYTTATINLSAGTPNTNWYDMLNYAWVSVEILTNASVATLTFQTSGDASQTNISSAALLNSTSVGSTSQISASGATVTLHGPRQGRYFRISSNLSGGNTASLVLTFFTQPSGLVATGVTAIGTLANNSNVPTTTNLGVLGSLANAAQPSWTEGRITTLSGDLKGNTRMRISDAAGNDRGANVNASNQLSVSVDNSPTFTAAVGSPAFVTTTPSTTGGWTPSLKNGLSNTNSQVKSGAGTLGGWYVYNPNSTATYLQIFDTATGSITVGTTTPKLSLAIPPLTGANIELTNGINFATAICVAATTTATGASAPGTAIDCNFWYK